MKAPDAVSTRKLIGLDLHLIIKMQTDRLNRCPRGDQILRLHAVQLRFIIELNTWPDPAVLDHVNSGRLLCQFRRSLPSK